MFEPLILLLLIADVSSDGLFVPADRVHEEPPRPKMLSHEVALALCVDPRQVDRALPLDVPDNLVSRTSMRPHCRAGGFAVKVAAAGGWQYVMRRF